MKVTMKSLLLILAIAGSPLILSADDGEGKTHPFSIHDMLAMDRISDPQVSPDGKRIVFVRRSTDLQANRGRTDLWLVDVSGAGLRRLTSHPAGEHNPRWSVHGGAIYFLSSRSDSTQIWKIPIDGGEAEQVTRLPLDVTGFNLSPVGTHLVLSMEVFPDAPTVAGTVESTTGGVKFPDGTTQITAAKPGSVYKLSPRICTAMTAISPTSNDLISVTFTPPGDGYIIVTGMGHVASHVSRFSMKLLSPQNGSRIRLP